MDNVGSFSNPWNMPNLHHHIFTTNPIPLPDLSPQHHPVFTTDPIPLRHHVFNCSEEPVWVHNPVSDYDTPPNLGYSAEDWKWVGSMILDSPQQVVEPLEPSPVEPTLPAKILEPAPQPPTNLGQRQQKKRSFWTKEEHLLFLKGIDAFGEGKWKSISTHILPTRSHIQIASHAQKFKIRHSLDGTDITKKKRKSIHDLTPEHVPDLRPISICTPNHR